MAPKKRLIDANELLRNAEDYGPISTGLADAYDIKWLVDAQPTVAAVEVVHGEWEIIEDDYLDLVEMKCSVCGESYGFEAYEDCIPKNYHYCPNCGAKMDGDGNA